MTETPSSFPIAVHFVFAEMDFVFLFSAAVVCHPVVSVFHHVLSFSSSFLFVSYLIPSFDTQGCSIFLIIILTLMYPHFSHLSAVLVDVALQIFSDCFS